MNIPKTVKVGDVVKIDAIDLTKHCGVLEEQERLDPQIRVVIYGEVTVLNPEYICVTFCKDVTNYDKSNFDERLYIPTGCINKVAVLKKGG